ncbi:ImmA/IrrE family metallo-endopeptidase [Cereibacter sphaeroides]|uniref:ImmA/IrrE family metallo-endopeptidase n=1 Tax=Cereibacter sphaeroides TaxID=1063 RepID=UPI001F297973|nr:ImmA/IrrE family metallo-endopeptidase [Cereibacter sphaeroides]
MQGRRCVTSPLTAARHASSANDKAIITVNSRSPAARQRFSIAHELGHWHHHRGQCLMCRVEDYHPRTGTSREADGRWIRGRPPDAELPVPPPRPTDEEA